MNKMIWIVSFFIVFVVGVSLGVILKATDYEGMAKALRSVPVEKRLEMHSETGITEDDLKKWGVSSEMIEKIKISQELTRFDQITYTEKPVPVNFKP